MKRLIFLMLILGISQFNFAQNSVVVSAYNSLKNGIPEKAKEYIDKAITNDESASEAKTWFYRGNIYLQVYSVAHMTDGLVKGISKDQIKQKLGEPLSMRNYKKLEDGERWKYNFDLTIYLSKGMLDHFEYPNEAMYKSLDNGKLLDVAYEAYQKSLKIDPKFMMLSLSPMNAMTGLEQVANYHYNAGINSYGSKNFKESLYSFEKANSTFKAVGKPNTEITYYTGVAAMAAQDTAKAVKYYEEAMAAGYTDKLLYYNLVNLYLAQNKIADAKRVMKKGRSFNAEDQDLLIMEANIYLKSGEAGEAEKILLKAVENDPKNSNLYYVIGANYDNILNDTNSTVEEKTHAFTEAEKAYNKAIELNPKYFDALFNNGVLLNNKAAEILVEASNLPLDKEKEYEALKASALEYLKKAQPFLEKARSINPKDKDTLILLKQIYLKTKNTAKFKEVNDILKTM